MKFSPILTVILAAVSLTLPACSHVEEEHVEAHKITATNPESRSLTMVQRYVCQIHSQHHVPIRALERGYLEAIKIKEGQKVIQGQELFKVIPILYAKKAEAEAAEARVGSWNTSTPKSCSKTKWSPRTR